MKLYEISDEVRLIERMLEEEDVDQESFLAALDGLNEERDAKIANIGLLVKELRSDVDARKFVIKRLQEKNKAADNRIEWLKNYIMSHIDKPVKTPLVSVYKQAGRESIVIDDIDQIPEKFIKVEKSVDKTALKKDVEEGFEYAGFHIAQGNDSIVIK